MPAQIPALCTSFDSKCNLKDTRSSFFKYQSLAWISEYIVRVCMTIAVMEKYIFRETKPHILDSEAI